MKLQAESLNARAYRFDSDMVGTMEKRATINFENCSFRNISKQGMKRTRIERLRDNYVNSQKVLRYVITKDDTEPPVPTRFIS